MPDSPIGPLKVLKVSRRAVHLKWSTQIEKINIDRYVIEKREATKSRWIKVATTNPGVTAVVVSDLTEDKLYYFRVWSENTNGRSSSCIELDIPVATKRVLEIASQPNIEMYTREIYEERTATGRYDLIVSERSTTAFSRYGDLPLSQVSADNLALKH